MLKWWNKTNRLVKLILLIIPVVNWWVVLFVRFAAFLNHPSLLRLIVLIAYLLLGWAWGFIDFVWVLLFNHLTFAKTM